MAKINSSQHILAFAGTKQSGKSSAANFVAGYFLTQAKRRDNSLQLPKTFSIGEKGELIIDASFTNSEGVVEIKPAVLDLRRRDIEFIEWVSKNVWPHVKIYAFADTLKELSVKLFGLTYGQVYGNEIAKTSPTKIEWNDMFQFLPPKIVANFRKAGKADTKMTAREFLQFFGTNICRTLYDDCWIMDCLTNIVGQGYPFCIVDDCRFVNEVKAIQSIGGKVIKLNRVISKDSHKSERGLVGLYRADYDLVIDNDDLTIVEKNQKILNYLYKIGWIGPHLEE